MKDEHVMNGRFPQTSPQASPWIRRLAWTAALAGVALALHFLPRMWADHVIGTTRRAASRSLEPGEPGPPPFVPTTVPASRPPATSGHPAVAEATPWLPTRNDDGGDGDIPAENPHRIPPLEASPPDSPRGRIIQSLTAVIDPELGISVVDMGLIRKVVLDGGKGVTITMILTSPLCPYLKPLLSEMRAAVASVDPKARVSIVIDYDTQWTPDYLTPRGRAALTEIFR